MTDPDVLKFDCSVHGITSTLDHGIKVTAIDPMKHASLVFCAGGTKEVLRITAEGELIFADPTEAAQALLTEWNRLTGRG